MRLRILVTGSAGLIGRPLCAALRGRGVEVARLDLHEDGAGRGDLCDPKALSAALVGVGGIVHLAAVSRVIEAEQDPARCAATNVDGLQRLIDQSLSSPRRPWLLFTSSREVDGHPDRLPVHEQAPSDLTHTDDVVRGILALIDRLDTGEPPPPPIQLVSGRAVRLDELARLAIALSPRAATLRAAPPRDFDVSCFVGDPDRAQRLLGWSAQVDLRAGLSHLIRAFGAGDPP
jgi:nucleoside-diphosphate-sugar epimerase